MKLDIELLMDGAATCSQVIELLRTDEGTETPLRECVRLNICEPLSTEIERLRDALRLIAEGIYTEKGAENWAKFVLEQ